MIITIPIPPHASLLCKVGDKVDLGSPFYQRKKTSDEIIEAAKKLDIKPEKIFKYTVRYVGENVNSGDVLAQKKGLLGSNKVTAKHSGILKEINHIEGTIVMSLEHEEESVVGCYFKGEIKEITASTLRLVVGKGIEITASKSPQLFGGMVVYFSSPDKQEFSDASGKIVVSQTLSHYQTSKLEALGAKGFITLALIETQIPYAQIAHEADYSKIISDRYSHCLIDDTYSKIYFYT